jgi:hypothetical protein
MKKKIILLFVFLFMSGCSACSSSEYQIRPTVLPNFNETVFLTNVPCSAPCWQGLKIGVSSENEVMVTIPSLGFIDQKTIREISQTIPDLNPENWVQGKEIIATCINRWEPCLRLGIANGKLRDINLKLDYGLTLDRAIKHFGIPDYVGYIHIGGDVIDCRVELIWLNEQILLHSKIFSTSKNVNDECVVAEKNGAPSTGLIIEEVFYLPLQDIQVRIENHQLIPYRGIK